MLRIANSTKFLAAAIVAVAATMVTTDAAFAAPGASGSPEAPLTQQATVIKPKGTKTRTFRITNVRGNASGLGAFQGW